jgi:hypothetical protein
MRMQKQKAHRGTFTRSSAVLAIVAVVVWTAVAPAGAVITPGSGTAGDGTPLLYAPDCLQTEWVQSEANGRGSRVPVNGVSFMSVGPRSGLVTLFGSHASQPAKRGAGTAVDTVPRKAELRI